MTIPTVMSNVEEKVTVTKLKKVYSTLTQAFEMAKIDYGLVEEWGLKEETSFDDETGEHILEDTFWDRLVPYLKYAKYDTAENMALVDEQWSILSLKDKSVNGPFYPQLQLVDGVCYTPFWTVSTTCDGEGHGTEYRYCGGFGVDLNCRKGPNVEGRDIFHFWVTNDSILPTGQQGQELAGGSNAYDFIQYCGILSKKPAGRGCTAWVIYNENMDYLRCGNMLSWDGRHKCPY